MDKEDLSNYRPITHLSFLSKLAERVVKLCLTEFLSNNNLLNSFQSAYIKHHSTEIALLSVHDLIIKAMSHQKVTYLTLLDQSAAFDTIDHTILLERFLVSLLLLSPGSSLIFSIVLYISIEDSVSTVNQLLFGVPQGSVLLSSSFHLIHHSS
jgi:hypothetical protein